MPIIRIEALPALPPRLLAGTAQAAAAAVGQGLGVDPDKVFVACRAIR